MLNVENMTLLTNKPMAMEIFKIRILGLWLCFREVRQCMINSNERARIAPSSKRLITCTTDIASSITMKNINMK